MGWCEELVRIAGEAAPRSFRSARTFIWSRFPIPGLRSSLGPARAAGQADAISPWMPTAK
jgi:hypothetical protein